MATETRESVQKMMMYALHSHLKTNTDGKVKEGAQSGTI